MSAEPTAQPLAEPTAGSAAGTFSPDPAAAPFRAQVLAQASMEARLLLRNGEQLLIALVIPVVVLVGGVLGAERVGLTFSAPVADVLTPGVLALAVMSTSFTSLAIATGFERRYGVIKWLGASPLPRSGLLGGKVLALLAVEVLQVVVVSAVGLALGWHPTPGALGLVGALLAAVLGTSAFASLALAMAGSLRAEATLAGANLVYLLLMAGGAVVLPADAYGSAGGWVTWLPSGALGESLRAGLLHGTVDPVGLAVLAVWTLAGALLTARTFTWE
ncbi:ABC transporter permease [Nocardioides sp. GY 10127]|uniref:ABC transporter permease n=1 Tax=Nocardioides sp. GY 10127 TaxID=2569762 RepID=UPI0010A83940|nr:ABC transporter permease [Nocardioides sp. GY 10127]TIC86546.1 ABC transporter permease [Nocardioides sp. GY 10127]